MTWAPSPTTRTRSRARSTTRSAASIEDAHASAHRVLREHMDELHRLSAILIERETIDKDQFERLLAGESEESVFRGAGHSRRRAGARGRGEAEAQAAAAASPGCGDAAAAARSRAPASGPRVRPGRASSRRAGLVAEGFRLEPLGPEHNERDYAAWSSSVEHIRRSPGYGPDSTWPRPMSLDENRARPRAACARLRGADGVHVHGARRRRRRDRLRLRLPGDGRRPRRPRPVLGAASPAPSSTTSLRRVVADWLDSEAWPFERPLYEPLLG